MEPQNTQPPIENIPSEMPKPISLAQLVQSAQVVAPIEQTVAVEPAPIVTPIAKPIAIVKKSPRQRHFLAAFFISFFWGAFGADRMYMGYWGLGFLKLISAGGLGIWVIIDLFLIMGGYMRDKQGREMLQIAEYKQFARNTVVILAASIGVAVLITGISLISALPQIMDSIQNGTIPGLDSLTGGSGGIPGVPADLQAELNR